MFKLIVTDLDETLISLDRSISLDNINSIKRCVEKGIKVVPATGRGYLTVQETLKLLNLYNKADQYVISFNGACISENKNNKVLYFDGIDFDNANRLYQLGLKYDICIHVYTDSEVFIYNYTDNERKYIANRMKVNVIDDMNIDFLKGNKIAKCLFMNTDMEYLKNMGNEVSTIFNDIEISYSSNRYIEFNNKGIDKGRALERLCKHLNIDKNEVLAIGDNYNDLSMIEIAGLGAGVKNMPEDIKKNCDYISNNDCDHSAVAEILNKFVLNN